MAYEFTKLSEVLDAETVSDECNVIVEDGGEIKKTAKYNIGKAQVQADWNQTDPTQPDYIKNKLSCDLPYQQLVTDGDGNTKWEDRLAYDKGRKNLLVINFAWIDNGYRIETEDMAMQFHDICDNYSEVMVAIGGQDLLMTTNWASGEYSLSYNNKQIIRNYIGGAHPYLIYLDLDNTSSIGIVGNSLGNEATVTLYIDGGVKTIDPKYIKDIYYTQTIPGSDGPIITFQAYLNTISPLTLSEPLIVGAPYTVNVGNDKCKTICTTDGEHLSITVSVQGSAQGSLIVDDPINNPLVALWNGAVTNKRIEIVRESQEEVKQIDPKYIPDTTVKVNITENEDGTPRADKTFNEVKTLIDSGVDVKCIINNMMVLDYVLNQGGQAYAFEFNSVAANVVVSVVFTPGGLVINQGPFDKIALPEVSTSDNNKFLSVVNGTWQVSSDLIVPSSTSGSTKKFKITVDDSGAITATEV